MVAKVVANAKVTWAPQSGVVNGVGTKLVEDLDVL